MSTYMVTTNDQIARSYVERCRPWNGNRAAQMVAVQFRQRDPELVSWLDATRVVDIAAQRNTARLEFIDAIELVTDEYGCDSYNITTQSFYDETGDHATNVHIIRLKNPNVTMESAQAWADSYWAPRSCEHSYDRCGGWDQSDYPQVTKLTDTIYAAVVNRTHRNV